MLGINRPSPPGTPIAFLDMIGDNLNRERKIIEAAGFTLVDCSRFKSNDRKWDAAFECNPHSVVSLYTPVTKKRVKRFQSLRNVSRYGVGYDNVKIKQMTELGIPVHNLLAYWPGVIGEHTVTILFALAKQVVESTNDIVDESKWLQFYDRPLHTLEGKTLGIIGSGANGLEVAKRLSGWGIKVIVYDPFPNHEGFSPYGAKFVGLNKLYKKSDYICICCPLIDSTRKMIDEEAISKMKKGVLIASCARGWIVDEKALVKGLESGQVGGFAADVIWDDNPERSPLVKWANKSKKNKRRVVLSGHRAPRTKKGQRILSDETAKAAVSSLIADNLWKSIVNGFEPDVEKILKKHSRYARWRDKSLANQSSRWRYLAAKRGLKYY